MHSKCTFHQFMHSHELQLFELQEWYEQVDGLNNINLLNTFYSDYSSPHYLTFKWLKIHIWSVHAFSMNQTHGLLFKEQAWYEQVDGLTNIKSLNKFYSKYLFFMYLTLKNDLHLNKKYIFFRIRISFSVRKHMKNVLWFLRSSWYIHA